MDLDIGLKRSKTSMDPKNILHYQKLMDKLLTLPSCALITLGGRSGSDFVQSLLDSHPQVLILGGSFFFHDFWENSLCVAAGSFDLEDILDEFIGKHIEKFKSRYDLQERKDQLGENADQVIDIDLDRFRTEARNLLVGREVSSKNFMLAIYAAYAMCLGEDIEKKSLLFHHQHHVEKLKPYLRDFPDSKIICTTRDPRAGFVSGIENWRKYDSTKDRELHLYIYIKKILEDANVLNGYKNPYLVVKIEDFDQEHILKGYAQWLGISFDECMKKSTWGGLLWHGDRLTVRKTEGAGLSRSVLRNKWEKKLSFSDKYTLNFITNNRLRHYQYRYRKINIFDTIAVPFLILLPLKYEWRYFSPQYISARIKNKEFRIILSNGLSYLKRVGLFLKYYVKILMGTKFEHPFLS